LSVVRACPEQVEWTYSDIRHGLGSSFELLTVIRDSLENFSSSGQLLYHGVALPLSYIGIYGQGEI